MLYHQLFRMKEYIFKFSFLQLLRSGEFGSHPPSEQIHLATPSVPGGQGCWTSPSPALHLSPLEDTRGQGGCGGRVNNPPSLVDNPPAPVDNPPDRLRGPEGLVGTI